MQLVTAKTRIQVDMVIGDLQYSLASGIFPSTYGKAFDVEGKSQWKSTASCQGKRVGCACVFHTNVPLVVHPRGSQRVGDL
ncbi:unnamed protein product [Pieris macdunnoughi]|uniref:Uncharacterized protein n=1 Tax=Pieris macdunnoughi TaxID=345717 RepID=A0A821MAQ4_9NEOP|nr:unnamed protein product [Pieris macdunnoughi]